MSILEEAKREKDRLLAKYGSNNFVYTEKFTDKDPRVELKAQKKETKTVVVEKSTIKVEDKEFEQWLIRAPSKLKIRLKAIAREQGLSLNATCITMLQVMVDKASNRIKP